MAYTQMVSVQMWRAHQCSQEAILEREAAFHSISGNKIQIFLGNMQPLRQLSRSHAQALCTNGQDKQTQLKPQGQTHNNGEGKPQEWRKAGCIKSSGSASSSSGWRYHWKYLTEADKFLLSWGGKKKKKRKYICTSVSVRLQLGKRSNNKKNPQNSGSKTISQIHGMGSALFTPYSAPWARHTHLSDRTVT